MVAATVNNVVVDTAHFPTYFEQCLLQTRARSLANKTWDEVNVDPRAHSPHYEKGFKKGFADYLVWGGSGEPPPVPPKHYWGADTPEGRQAAQEWFAGFRHGAALAKKSGARETIVVPASSSLLQPSPPPYLGGDVAHGHPAGREEDIPVLPPPRRVEPEAPAKK